MWNGLEELLERLNEEAIDNGGPAIGAGAVTPATSCIYAAGDGGDWLLRGTPVGAGRLVSRR